MVFYSSINPPGQPIFIMLSNFQAIPPVCVSGYAATVNRGQHISDYLTMLSLPY